MSRIIFMTLMACACTYASHAQVYPSDVALTYHDGHAFLYQKFGNFDTKALRITIARMSLYGVSQLGDYSFERTGEYKDKIKITKKDTKNDVSFQLEISESTFLYFINEREREQERDERAKVIFFTSIK